MRVLVGAASRHGATTEIAEASGALGGLGAARAVALVAVLFTRKRVHDWKSVLILFATWLVFYSRAEPVSSVLP